MIRNKLPRIDAIPFEAQQQQLFIIILRNVDEPKQIIYVKGAIEKILRKCTTVLVDIKQDTLENSSIKIDLTRQISSKIRQQAEEMEKSGLRIIDRRDINYTEKIQSVTIDILEKGLVFLRFAAMIDPLRRESIESIATCHTAGIDVKMFTGDNMSPVNYHMRNKEKK